MGTSIDQQRNTLSKEDGPLSTARFKNSARSAMRHSEMVVNSQFPGENVWVSGSSLVKDYSNPVWTRINADSIPSACFVGQGLYFDVQLTGGNYVGYCDHIILELILINNAATSIAIGPVHQLFDKIELLFNGSNIADTLYPENLYLNYMMDLPDEKRSKLSYNYGWQRQTDRDSTLDPYLLRNYDAEANGAGIIIPANGGQRTIYAEIPCHLAYMHLYLPVLQRESGPRFRFYPSPNNCLMTTTLGTATDKPQIQQAQFIIIGPQFAPMVAENIYENHMSFPVITPGIGHDRQIISYTPVDGDESGDQNFTATTGQIAGFFMIVRPVAVSNENLFSPGGAQTWREFDEVTFRDGAGRSVGFEKEPMQVYRSFVWNDHFASNLALEKCLLWWPFCKSLMSDILYGSNTGSYDFSGRETIRFTPYSVTNNSFLVNTPHEILVFAYRHSMARLDKGVVNFYKL